MKGSALAQARNLLKAWLLLAGLCAVLGLVGYGLGGFRFATFFAFSGLLIGASFYWYADRTVIAMVGARELPTG